MVDWESKNQSELVKLKPWLQGVLLERAKENKRACL